MSEDEKEKKIPDWLRVALARIESNERIEMAKIEWEKEKWQQEKESSKELYELIKGIIKGSVSEAKNVMEAVKTGVDVAKAQTTQETLKQYYDMFLKPSLDLLAEKDKEIMKMKIKEMESKILDPLEYIKRLREVAKDLGLSSDVKSEIDLKLAEMACMSEREKMSLQWETEKYSILAKKDKEIAELRAKLVESRTEDLNAYLIHVVERARNLRLQVILCPGCGKPIIIIPGSPRVVCPHCERLLEC